MAKLITIQLLVDSDCECEIADGINEILREHTQPSESDTHYGWLIDYTLFGQGDPLETSGTLGGLSDISPEIEDAIVNGTYEEGDAFR